MDIQAPERSSSAWTSPLRLALLAGGLLGLGVVVWLLLVPGRENGEAQIEQPAAEERGVRVNQGNLKGWELNETNTGLAAIGLTCDELPIYTGSDKPKAGTTIIEKRIETVLDLSDGGVTIERSCIRPTNISRGLPLVTTTDVNRCNDDGCPTTSKMVTLRDCEIDGSRADNYTVAYSLGFGGIGTIERCNIHDVGSGIGIVNTGNHLGAIVVGNYVHRLRAWGSTIEGSHNDGLTIRDFQTEANPDRQATVLNNRVDASSGNDTGALFIQPNGGHIDNVLVQGNLLEGNGYQLGLERGNEYKYGRFMRALDNRFSGTDYGPGYVDSKGLGYGWQEWRDNYIADDRLEGHRGLPVPPPEL